MCLAPRKEKRARVRKSELAKKAVRTVSLPLLFECHRRRRRRRYPSSPPPTPLIAPLDSPRPVASRRHRRSLRTPRSRGRGTSRSFITSNVRYNLYNYNLRLVSRRGPTPIGRVRLDRDAAAPRDYRLSHNDNVTGGTAGRGERWFADNYSPRAVRSCHPSRFCRSCSAYVVNSAADRRVT